jgi:hypothetical protein
MSSTKYCEVVAAIPYPGGTRYVKVGAMLQMDHNDETKGPGFVIMLDRYFNPAGIPGRDGMDSSSIALSTYWPRLEGEVGKKNPSQAPKPAERDDDIPF